MCKINYLMLGAKRYEAAKIVAEKGAKYATDYAITTKASARKFIKEFDRAGFTVERPYKVRDGYVYGVCGNTVGVPIYGGLFKSKPNLPA